MARCCPKKTVAGGRFKQQIDALFRLINLIGLVHQKRALKRPERERDKTATPGYGGRISPPIHRRKELNLDISTLAHC
jgi:hypothetical protein